MWWSSAQTVLWHTSRGWIKSGQDHWTLKDVLEYIQQEDEDICFSDYARLHHDRLINNGRCVMPETTNWHINTSKGMQAPRRWCSLTWHLHLWAHGSQHSRRHIERRKYILFASVRYLEQPSRSITITTLALFASRQIRGWRWRYLLLTDQSISP